MQHTSNALLRRASLALAIAAVNLGAIASAAPAIGAPITVARATLLDHDDVVIGELRIDQPIHVEVALKLRNRDLLDAFIANAPRNRMGGVGQPMSAIQYMTDHAPTQARAQAVANYLASKGYRNIVIAPNRLLVSADGTAATARNAFLTSFKQVRTGDGRMAFANVEDVRIPTALQDTVLAVVGLQTVHQAHTFARASALRGDAAPNSICNPGSNLGPARNATAITCSVGHYPGDFQDLYSFGTVGAASGVSVGIVSNGNLLPTFSDLNQAYASHAPVQVVNTHGTGTDTTNTNEWDLDSQTLAIVGRVGGIVFYATPTLSESDLVANFNTIVTANAVKIINVSLGECENTPHADGTMAAADQIFALGAAQGQTFSVSTGDTGADECQDGYTSITPAWPASSPYVIAVAGTTLKTPPDDEQTWANELVWNSNNGYATGGSPSLYEPKPSWQTKYSGATRGVADVAFDANPNSGEMIIVNGVWKQYGGTSLAAPIFASEWARILQAKGATLGFAGPIVYGLPAADFHDITVGTNDSSGRGGPEHAAAGYDLATGRGSIILSSAINNIVNKPPVANFSHVATKLVVTFTDTSTDSNGTIASHAWTFGDGGTSTAANPSHTYAVANTYSVTETVTDSRGATSSKTESVAPK